jgi:hypothetical protein
MMRTLSMAKPTGDVCFEMLERKRACPRITLLTRDTNLMLEIATCRHTDSHSSGRQLAVHDV